MGIEEIARIGFTVILLVVQIACLAFVVWLGREFLRILKQDEVFGAVGLRVATAIVLAVYVLLLRAWW